MSDRLTAGDVLPDITLTDDRGKNVTLSELLGRRVMVYFYSGA